MDGLTYPEIASPRYGSMLWVPLSADADAAWTA